jgi:hypothetical protein
MEINRFKNGQDVTKTFIKEICFFAHSTLPKSSFLGHARGAEIFCLHLPAKAPESALPKDSKSRHSYFEPQLMIDLRSVQDTPTIKAMSLQANPVRNGQFLVGSTNGIYLFSLQSEPLYKIAAHYTFTCPLSFQQVHHDLNCRPRNSWTIRQSSAR